MNVHPPQDGIVLAELGSWRQFGEFIQACHTNDPSLIYRGQGTAEWDVRSSLDRLEHRHRTHNTYIHGNSTRQYGPPIDRKTHLMAFQDACRGRRGPNAPDCSNWTEYEWWALAQHHGLATPMLDWTSSPFAALFFAFEEERTCSEDGSYVVPKSRVVFALRVRSIADKHSDKDPAPRPFVPQADSNYRMVNQAGVLLHMPQGTDLESYVRRHYPDTSVIDEETLLWKMFWRITIPNDERIECLKYLNKMNINRMSLFPDLDGVSAYINALWELDFDSNLGDRGPHHLPARRPPPMF